MSDQPVVNDSAVINQAAPATSRSEQEERQALQDLSQGKGGKLSMNVRVYAPFREYYDGPAFSISA